MSDDLKPARQPRPESVKIVLTRNSRGLTVGDILEVDVERAAELVESSHARYCE